MHRPTHKIFITSLLLLAGAHAHAHQSSVVYADIATQGRDVDIRLQISNGDLYEALGIDRDRPVSRAEVRAGHTRLVDYLRTHIGVHNGQVSCAPSAQDLEFSGEGESFFVVVPLRFDCRRTAADATVRYDLFFDVDPRHQAFAKVHTSGTIREHVFRAADRTLRLETRTSLLDHIRDYLILGIEHIFTGYDHLAFLFGLLIIAAGVQSSARYVIGIVTAFTIAHSVTLISAGLGLLSLPARFVEPAIALSIVYVAVENVLMGTTPRHRWFLTFGFGLVHGFGFASVLREIGLPPRGVMLSLLSFNVGVELGQLAVVALVLPVLHLLERGNPRRHELAALVAAAPIVFAVFSYVGLGPVQLAVVVFVVPLLLFTLTPRLGYDRVVRVGGSAALAGLATFWFFERVLERSWLGGALG